jgi:arylsulfatase A-like enzyme
MRARAFKTRIATVILVGLVLGALGLLEPLLGYWGEMHQIGIGWPSLLLLYLGGGLLVSVLAGVLVTIAYAGRSSQWLPITAVAHYATGALALAVVIVLAPPLHYELRAFGLPSSYPLVTPLLLAVAVLVVAKGTPRVWLPLTARLLGEPSGRVARTRVAVLTLAVLLVAPVTVIRSVESGQRARGRPARPELRTRPGAQEVQNVLLITVDALRADRLGTYGYRRPTSPRIDSLATRSTVFTRCFAQGNVTELSMGALFTSLYPSMHGVRRQQRLASPLAPEIETLAENLRDAGLRTAGLMSNPYLKREWGLTQGFDAVEEFQYGYLRLLPLRLLKVLHLFHPPARIGMMEVPSATAVTDRALARLARDKQRPFFLFAHYMDVHHPYLPPARFEGLFHAPGATSIAADALWRRSWPLFHELPSDKELFAPGDLRRFGDLYDGSIRYVDTEIGRLLDGLAALGLDRSTLVVIAADHGDEFLEHGYMLHLSPYLYDELIHVPLIVHWPGQTAGRSVSPPVRLIDVMPTLLAVFDLPACPSAQGRSLLPVLRGEPDATPAPPVFSQSYECAAVRTASRKLMYDLPHDQAFCFRLQDDPQELRNAQGQDTGCDSLGTILVDFLKRATLVPNGVRPTELDPRTREVLRSIGYVSM